MDQAQVLDIAKEAIWTLVVVSTPVLLVAMLVGLLIGIVQTLTQIQEITLVFVPKILLVFLAILFLLPFMSAQMMQFSETIFDRIVAIGISKS